MPIHCKTNPAKHWICQGDFAWESGYLVSRLTMDNIVNGLRDYEAAVGRGDRLLEESQNTNKLLVSNLHLSEASTRRTRWQSFAMGSVVGIFIGAAITTATLFLIER